MERGDPLVGAVVAQAIPVAQHSEIGDAADTDVVQAVSHEVILSPHRQHHAHVREAHALVPGVGIDGLEGEDFQGAVHHREVWRVRELVAIHNVDLLTEVRCHVQAHAFRDHDCIRVDLQDPSVIAPAAILYHDVPDVDEELGIACRAVDRPGDRSRGNMDGLDFFALVVADHGLVVSGQHSVLIATEDARTPAHRIPDHIDLIGRGHDQGEAEERWGALQGEAVAARAQRLAAPSPVVVLHMEAGGAILHAHPKVVILLIALLVHSEAALRGRAIIEACGARLWHPFSDLPCSGHGRRRCLRAHGLATPVRTPRLGGILAWCA
mmetsp:Transcript_23773/g.67278  ORF Transcript_23773/g.67278 Transcript_23773/m.67278 type:complete len:324 (+) Transcript_23773:222-1193(+)